MNILITGGGGYLGTVLVRQLLQRLQHQVRVFDRFSWGTQPLASVASEGNRPVQVMAGDIRNVHQLSTALDGIDVIVHLAAIVGYPACDADPEDADTTNIDGTRLLVKLAEGRPIFFASTGSCYGRQQEPATEETPLSPLTRYGRTKAEGEQRVLDGGGVCLRLATLYGLSPRMRWDLLPNDFARRGVSGVIHLYDPAAQRTFLHVEDAASAFRWFLDNERGPAIYNVGDAAFNLTKLNVAEHVKTFTDCQIVAADGSDPDGRDYVVDYQKLRHRSSEVPSYSSWMPVWGFDLSDLVAFARVWK